MTHRVLIVSPYALDRFGGVQQQVDGTAAALARLGDSVAVLAPGEGTARDHHGYRLYPTGRSIAVPINGSRAPVGPTPAAYRAVLRTLDEFAPDVLHVHEPLVPGPSLFALRAFSGPTVGTFHRARPGQVYPLWGHALGSTVGGIAVQVAVSEAAADTAAAAVGREFRRDRIVPNGIDADGIGSRSRVPQDEPTILFIGRHEPRKGLGVLLEAVTRLATAPRVWVVGDGPERAALRRRYDDDRIRWLGAVDDEEKFTLLASADLLVAPSLGGESFGVILLEAMAAGVAVVASDLPGYREAAGSVARYAPPGDAVALAAAIDAVLTDAVERSRRAEAGRAAAQQFDFAAIGATYRDLYDLAADRHRERPRRTRPFALRRMRP